MDWRWHPYRPPEALAILGHVIDRDANAGEVGAGMLFKADAVSGKDGSEISQDQNNDRPDDCPLHGG
jgi:hypothetical protein